MPSCSTFGYSSLESSKKTLETYFQRKKVGSIRDNPKLLRIRQQFENASLDSTQGHSGSAPNSLRGPKNSVALRDLFKSDAQSFFESQLSGTRRRSEGEGTTFSAVPSSKTDAVPKRDVEKSASSHSSESGIHTGSSTSEEDSSSASSPRNSQWQAFTSAEIDKPPPPIPKRGISASGQKNLNSITKKSASPSKDNASTNLSKSNSVRRTIQMYEGMSSIDSRRLKSSRIPSPKGVARRDPDGKRSSIPRRCSRRNSLRRPKPSVHKDDPSVHKEDSGVVLSDADDKQQQSIYQTLSVTVVPEQHCFDPYDRLSRIHDMVSRIHKGLSSACAACKAIPSRSLRLGQEDGSSMLKVQCNEAAPHHHPPCICFSCQHSIFTCAQPQKAELEASDAQGADPDGLYYNMCCLNPPNRGDAWRQSRRRPVCEQNGRLCIVNCDMELRRSEQGGEAEMFYERLCEWQSSPSVVPKMRHRAKHASGDSCDSDEGWVDVTDSEDEKHLLSNNRLPSLMKQRSQENLSSKSRKHLIFENCAYDLERIVTKCSTLDLSRSSSTEHLYESIADMEEATQEEDTANRSSNGSSTLSLKSEPTELDSGEWSTESVSSTFDEQTLKSTSDNQRRFTLGSGSGEAQSQENAKKTFMKSVLGKKSTVGPKKRRMSNFFVPWLVSGGEYVDGRGAGKACAKNKRSQSVPSCVPAVSISCVSSGSAELLDGCKGELSDSEQDASKCSSNTLNVENISPRGSVASSSYVRADQIQTFPASSKSKGIASVESATDVSVERICRRSSSGDSEHSYILFQPVKEEEVPLYQFYERNIKERVSFCRSPNSMSPIMWSENGGDFGAKSARSQLSVVEQLSPDAKDMKMLWCELPEVKDSGILERISAQELKLQEATFEFIQSQASYIRSLKVLFEHFIKVPEFSDINSSTCVLSKHEHDVLFSDIIRIKEVSERLMGELTTRWSDGILIPDICDIIHRHAVMPSFSVYVRYCSNRVYQERTLKEIKETRLCFLEVLRKLESNPACQGLSLESFLFLPMQHIARLPLLLDNIFRWLVPDSPSYSVCKMALEAVHKSFMDCNEGARKMERLEEMFVLNRQLEFKECKVIPLISASRWLLKKGELVKLEFDKKTFGRSSRCIRVPVYIFLFNDLLVITKRKSEDCYTVVDYCAREKVQAMVVNAKDLQPPIVVPNTCRYLLYLTLFHNHQGSAVDMILNCTVLSERTRWIEAIHAVPKDKPCEVWEYDCPQVQCVRSYIAQQPDELSLQESDVVTIHRKMNDGWYEGRRLRDGLQGWFPASYTMDIPCSRARASNLRQCYRLLMLSQNQ